jgi:hypothetical protein
VTGEHRKPGGKAPVGKVNAAGAANGQTKRILVAVKAIKAGLVVKV